MSIPKWLYYEYRQRPRGPWGSRDYDEYVLDTLDDNYMRSLGQTIEDAMGGDYYATIECAFNFAQAAVRYIPDPSGFEYPRYPIESLVDGIGDCEDSAILHASLVRTLEYGALISAVDTDGNGNADHMIALVPVHEAYAASLLAVAPDPLPASGHTEASYTPLPRQPGNRRDTINWDAIRGGLAHRILSKYGTWPGWISHRR